jgi:hypothetical protein
MVYPSLRGNLPHSPIEWEIASTHCGKTVRTGSRSNCVKVKEEVGQEWITELSNKPYCKPWRS